MLIFPTTRVSKHSKCLDYNSKFLNIKEPRKFTVIQEIITGTNKLLTQIPQLLDKNFKESVRKMAKEIKANTLKISKKTNVSSQKDIKGHMEILQYKYNIYPLNFSLVIQYCRNCKLILKFLWKCKGCRIGKAIYHYKNRVERMRFPSDFKTHYKITITKIVWGQGDNRILVKV